MKSGRALTRRGRVRQTAGKHAIKKAGKHAIKKAGKLRRLKKAHSYTLITSTLPGKGIERS